MKIVKTAKPQIRDSRHNCTYLENPKRSQSSMDKKRPWAQSNPLTREKKTTEMRKTGPPKTYPARIYMNKSPRKIWPPSLCLRVDQPVILLIMIKRVICSPQPVPNQLLQLASLEKWRRGSTNVLYNQKSMEFEERFVFQAARVCWAQIVT